MKTTTERVWLPKSEFVPGCSFRTQVEKWVHNGRRMYVYFKDGLVAHSEETLRTIEKIGYEVTNST